jgi:TPR repeat protein
MPSQRSRVRASVLTARMSPNSLRRLVDQLKAQKSKRNERQAFLLSKQGAALNDPYLTWVVGDAYEHGEGVEKSLRKAKHHYEVAVRLGSIEATTSLGVYLWERARSEDDRRRALRLYRKAARHNEPNAIHNLGVIYSLGNVVRQSPTAAYRHFLRAAKLGHTEAQFKVGWCLLYGEGTARDRAAARKWLGAAARHGQTDAHKLLQQIKARRV